MSLRNAARLSGAVLPALFRSIAADGPACLATAYAGTSSGGTVAAAVARSFRTSASCFSLADRLKQELEYEESQIEEDSGVQTPPNGFKLEEKALKTVITLTKPFGEEQVKVEINTLDQNDAEMEVDEDDEDAAQNYPINFIVGCTKGDHTLKFMCSYLEDDTDPPAIEHVAFEPKGGYPADDIGSVYEGPAFQELDDKLQTEFQEYLAARGITAELGQYLCRANYDKEQREYVSWLERVHSHVAV